VIRAEEIVKDGLRETREIVIYFNVITHYLPGDGKNHE
jgi:hypothetical protein